MATAPMSLDKPPVQPPDVTGQMGAPSGPPPPPNAAAGVGAGNPQGAVLAQLDTVKKVLDQVATQSDAFAPFAARAKTVIDEGIAAVSGGSPASQAAPAQPPPGGDAGASFPG